MKDRVLRDLELEDIARVANTFHAWKRGEGYADEAGFCKSATLDDIRKSDYVLTPGRYVGAAALEEDGEAFEDKMARLTQALASSSPKALDWRRKSAKTWQGWAMGFDRDNRAMQRCTSWSVALR